MLFVITTQTIFSPSWDVRSTKASKCNSSWAQSILGTNPFKHMFFLIICKDAVCTLQETQCAFTTDWPVNAVTRKWSLLCSLWGSYKIHTLCRQSPELFNVKTCTCCYHCALNGYDADSPHHLNKDDKIHTGADTSSVFLIWSTTKRIFLGWAKEVRATKS
jgi:hypothetical protein